MLKPRVAADERKVITNVFVWDGTNTPRSSVPREVLLCGNQIHEIGEIGSFNSNIKIDGKGMTLMPGLIEGHCHLTFPNSWDFDIPPEEHTLITMHNAKTVLDSGYTSAFSAASAKVRLDVVIRNEINSGRIVGPRLRAASPELTPPGGLGDGIVKGLHESNTFGYICKGPDEIRKACQIMVAQGVDTVKVNISGEEYSEDGLNIKSTFNSEEVAAAIEVCHAAGVRVAAHCRGTDSVKSALKEGIDILYHCEFADDEQLSEMVKRKDQIFLGPAIGYLVKGGIGQTGEPDKKAAIAANTYKKLHAMDPDMNVVVGGDYGFPNTPHGTNAFDLTVFVDWLGYTPIQTLVCATSTGGKLMNMPVGKIQKGYLADLLLVNGDPTVDVSILLNKDNLRMIIQDGYIYKNTLSN